MIEQGVYQHYKGGLYTVLMAARCGDNGDNNNQNVVVYVSHSTGKVCTRLAKEFFGTVGDKPRFAFVAHALTPEVRI